MTDREPISDEQVAAEVDEIVAYHDSSPPSTRTVLTVPVDRRTVISLAIGVACFAALAVLALVTCTLVIVSQRSTIAGQAETIGVERSRSSDISAQLDAARHQINDADNQQKCRSQIANDYEDVRTQYDLLVAQRDRLFRKSLSTALQGDRQAFMAELAEATALDPNIEALEPKVQAAVAARRDSVQTCAAQAAVSQQGNGS